MIAARGVAVAGTAIGLVAATNATTWLQDRGPSAAGFHPYAALALEQAGASPSARIGSLPATPASTIQTVGDALAPGSAGEQPHVANPRLATLSQRAIETELGHGWRLPITHYRFTSPFGMRWGQLHAGIDLALPSGSKLHAMSTGKVILAKWLPGAGFQLIIRYWDGTQSWFDHLSRYHCKVGEKVVEGTVVGFSGRHRPLDRPASAPGDPPARRRPGQPGAVADGARHRHPPGGVATLSGYCDSCAA